MSPRPCRWNFTPSPGWTKEESLILKLCLMKFGIGQWVQIQATGLLPGKLIQQLNGATQRLFGQQSLAGELLLRTRTHLAQHTAPLQRRGAATCSLQPSHSRSWKADTPRASRWTATPCLLLILPWQCCYAVMHAVLCHAVRCALLDTLVCEIRINHALCRVCAAFSGLRVDIDRIRADNAAKTDAKRKSGLIIWSGGEAAAAYIAGCQHIV